MLGHLQGYHCCSHQELLHLETNRFSFDDPVLIFPKAINVFEL
jgi:hypothetical protein